MARLLSVVGLESVRFISVSLPLRLLGGKSSDDYLVIDRIVQSTLHASNGRFNKILLTNGRRIDRLHLVATSDDFNFCVDPAPKLNVER
ncbi:hypothetical protein K443DRAFT_11565 [Laccaria amethystina LaAM-08-1]|uniref:Uncharacterized protein n=1 Tax=Laccaria amethystina LaAM-08-1 TaxID=1095629 RepID=A0A0C9WJR7_9AGAR|nr:hypothetical protein K443DRAFT_11565 [Laccaria amethystina LaAM-08-1]